MSITYRTANDKDIDLLIKLRLDYLKEDWGTISKEQENIVLEHITGYYKEHLNKDFFAFLAFDENEIVATVFLAMSEKPANLSYTTGKVATVMNVLTYPSYRKQGIATKLLNMLIEKAFIENASYIKLSATEAGKPVYEKLGFKVHNSRYAEMVLKPSNINL